MLADTETHDEPKRFYGKYRGTVMNNIDPMQRGRIMVQIADYGGLFPSTWAEACFPVGGIQYGSISVPLVGAGVWIEFEQGDPDYPSWTGIFYGSSAEVPALAKSITPGVPGFAQVTPLQNGMVISDVPGPSGGIMIKGSLGTITMNETGITIQNGKGASISLIGAQVTINSGAFVVT